MEDIKKIINPANIKNKILLLKTFSEMNDSLEMNQKISQFNHYWKLFNETKNFSFERV
jgi:hypothetical protein